MNDVVQLELARGSDSYDQALSGIDGLAPLSESEWANLFMTLGSSDDTSFASTSQALDWDVGPYSMEMEAATFAIAPPSSTYSSSATSTLPSSPESGSESSPQTSPQTSPYNDFLFSLPVLAIKDETLSSSSSSTGTLPSIEPFPPRSPIFEQQQEQQMRFIGNVGVAAPMDVVAQTKASALSGSYRQHLGQPLASISPSATKLLNEEGASASAGDDEDAASKKRRRAAGAVPSEIAAATSGVVLPRDTLLKLSSAEMEAYLQALKASRELTHAEEKQLKKQLRLIKNREYAQESRKKKKSAHQELEGELTSLRTQNSELRTHNSALQSEVVLLNSKLAAVTSENTRLRSALRQMQHFHNQHQSNQKKQSRNANNKRQRGDEGDYSGGSGPSSPSSWFSLGMGSAPVQSPKAVAGTVCLLAVAFFALSFLLQGPGMMGSHGGGVGWSPTSRVILEQEETTTTYSRRTWTPTTATVDTSSSSASKLHDRRGSSSSSKSRELEEGEGVAKCGHDNMCYLYADKAHHVKTAERDPSGPHDQQQRHGVVDQRQNLTHHAIPIPVH